MPYLDYVFFIQQPFYNFKHEIWKYLAKQKKNFYPQFLLAILLENSLTLLIESFCPKKQFYLFNFIFHEIKLNIESNLNMYEAKTKPRVLTEFSKYSLILKHPRVWCFLLS